MTRKKKSKFHVERAVFAKMLKKYMASPWPADRTRPQIKELVQAEFDLQHVPDSVVNDLAEAIDYKFKPAPQGGGWITKKAAAEIEKRVGRIEHFLETQFDIKLKDEADAGSE